MSSIWDVVAKFQHGHGSSALTILALRSAISATWLCKLADGVSHPVSIRTAMKGAIIPTDAYENLQQFYKVQYLRPQ